MAKARRLESYVNNQLSLCCEGCGHKAMLPAKTLIDKFGPDAQLKEAIAKLRCRQCEQIGKVTYLITKSRDRS